MVEESGIGSAAPALVGLPPTIARDGGAPAPSRAAPAAARLARAPGQRPALPRHLAARRRCRCCSRPSRVDATRCRCRSRTLPPTFDGAGRADARAASSPAAIPTALPGPPARAARGAAGSRDQLRRTGSSRSRRPLRARRIPGRGRAPLAKRLAVVPGRSPERDRRHGAPRQQRRRPGRERQRLRHRGAHRARPRLREPAAATAQPRAEPAHTLVFLSTDGGAFGGARRQRTSPRTHDGARRRGRRTSTRSPAAAPPRLVLAGDAPRSPRRGARRDRGRAASPSRRASGREPAEPRSAQLIDLGFPFSLYEQAPLVGRGIPAVTLTTAGDRPPRRLRPTAGGSTRTASRELGRAAQQLLESLDQGVELRPGRRATSTSARALVRGWAIELVLIAMLAAVPRGGGRPLRPLPPAAHPARAGAAQLPQPRSASGSGRRRSSSCSRSSGVWPAAPSAPLRPGSAAAGDWPVLGAHRARRCSARSAGSSRGQRLAPARGRDRRGGARRPHAPRCSRSAWSRCSSSRRTRSR